MHITHYVSLLVLVLITIGLVLRKKPKPHLIVMTTAFVVDMALLVYVELTLRVVEHAVEETLKGGSALLYFHIAVSVAVIVLYILQIKLGLKVYRGERTSLKLHRNLGMLFCVCRLLNFVTSFYV